MAISIYPTRVNFKTHPHVCSLMSVNAPSGRKDVSDTDDNTLYDDTTNTTLLQEILGMNVRSKERKDLGTIQNTDKSHIEISRLEGIAFKTYFVPIQFIETYDGENLYLSLTEDQVKSRYATSQPPSSGEQEYIERKEPVYIDSATNSLKYDAQKMQIGQGYEFTWNGMDLALVKTKKDDDVRIELFEIHRD